MDGWMDGWVDGWMDGFYHVTNTRFYMAKNCIGGKNVLRV